MKIGFLTQYYYPELGAPQQRLGELARFLVRRGHDVRVLTAHPSYPKGKVFDGYGGVLRHDDVDGVRVTRTFIYPSQSARMVPRLASYFSFVGSSLLAGAVDLPRLDYLLVESPPLFLGLSAMALARAKRARLIFNVSDLWPESAVHLGVVRRGSASWRAAAQLEARCYRAAWRVTGQSKTILADIAQRFPDVPTFHLSNGCDTTQYSAARATRDARQQLDPSGSKFVFIYAGLHGLAQGLDQILDAAVRTRDDDRIAYVLVGDGPEKAALRARAHQQQLHNVRFLDPVPAAQVPALLASADGILVTLKMDIPGAVPSKIYEAMASERPVILVAVGEAADIVTDAGGFVVEPGDGAGLEGAIRRVAAGGADIAARVARARSATEQRYDRAAIAQRFAELLEQRT